MASAAAPPVAASAPAAANVDLTWNDDILRRCCDALGCVYEEVLAFRAALPTLPAAEVPPERSLAQNLAVLSCDMPPLLVAICASTDQPQLHCSLIAHALISWMRFTHDTLDGVTLCRLTYRCFCQMGAFLQSLMRPNVRLDDFASKFAGVVVKCEVGGPAADHLHRRGCTCTTDAPCPLPHQMTAALGRCDPAALGAPAWRAYVLSIVSFIRLAFAILTTNRPTDLTCACMMLVTHARIEDYITRLPVAFAWGDDTLLTVTQWRMFVPVDAQLSDATSLAISARFAVHGLLTPRLYTRIHFADMLKNPVSTLVKDLSRVQHDRHAVTNTHETAQLLIDALRRANMLQTLYGPSRHAEVMKADTSKAVVQLHVLMGQWPHALSQQLWDACASMHSSDALHVQQLFTTIIDADVKQAQRATQQLHDVLQNVAVSGSVMQDRCVVPVHIALLEPTVCIHLLLMLVHYYKCLDALVGLLQHLPGEVRLRQEEVDAVTRGCGYAEAAAASAAPSTSPSLMDDGASMDARLGDAVRLFSTVLRALHNSDVHNGRTWTLVTACALVLFLNSPVMVEGILIDTCSSLTCQSGDTRVLSAPAAAWLAILQDVITTAHTTAYKYIETLAPIYLFRKWMQVEEQLQQARSLEVPAASQGSRTELQATIQSLVKEKDAGRSRWGCCMFCPDLPAHLAVSIIIHGFRDAAAHESTPAVAHLRLLHAVAAAEACNDVFDTETDHVHVMRDFPPEVVQSATVVGDAAMGRDGLISHVLQGVRMLASRHGGVFPPECPAPSTFMLNELLLALRAICSRSADPHIWREGKPHSWRLHVQQARGLRTSPSEGRAWADARPNDGIVPAADGVPLVRAFVPQVLQSEPLVPAPPPSLEPEYVFSSHVGISCSSLSELLRMTAKNASCRDIVLWFIADGCGWFVPPSITALQMEDDSTDRTPLPMLPCAWGRYEVRITPLGPFHRGPCHAEVRAPIEAFFMTNDPLLSCWLWPLLLHHACDTEGSYALPVALQRVFMLRYSTHEAVPPHAEFPAPALQLLRAAITDSSATAFTATMVVRSMTVFEDLGCLLRLALRREASVRLNSSIADLLCTLPLLARASVGILATPRMLVRDADDRLHPMLFTDPSAPHANEGHQCITSAICHLLGVAGRALPNAAAILLGFLVQVTVAAQASTLQSTPALRSLPLNDWPWLLPPLAHPHVSDADASVVRVKIVAVEADLVHVRTQISHARTRADQVNGDDALYQAAVALFAALNGFASKTTVLFDIYSHDDIATLQCKLAAKMGVCARQVALLPVGGVQDPPGFETELATTDTQLTPASVALSNKVHIRLMKEGRLEAGYAADLPVSCTAAPRPGYRFTDSEDDDAGDQHVPTWYQGAVTPVLDDATTRLPSDWYLRALVLRNGASSSASTEEAFGELMPGPDGQVTPQEGLPILQAMGDALAGDNQNLSFAWLLTCDCAFMRMLLLNVMQPSFTDTPAHTVDACVMAWNVVSNCLPSSPHILRQLVSPGDVDWERFFGQEAHDGVAASVDDDNGAVPMVAIRPHTLTAAYVLRCLMFYVRPRMNSNLYWPDGLDLDLWRESLLSSGIIPCLVRALLSHAPPNDPHNPVPQAAHLYITAACVRLLAALLETPLRHVAREADAGDHEEPHSAVIRAIVDAQLGGNFIGWLLKHTAGFVSELPWDDDVSLGAQFVTSAREYCASVSKVASESILQSMFPDKDDAACHAAVVAVEDALDRGLHISSLMTLALSDRRASPLQRLATLSLKCAEGVLRSISATLNEASLAVASSESLSYPGAQECVLVTHMFNSYRTSLARVFEIAVTCIHTLRQHVGKSASPSSQDATIQHPTIIGLLAMCHTCLHRVALQVARVHPANQVFVGDARPALHSVRIGKDIHTLITSLASCVHAMWDARADLLPTQDWRHVMQVMSWLAARPLPPNSNMPLLLSTTRTSYVHTAVVHMLAEWTATVADSAVSVGTAMSICSPWLHPPENARGPLPLQPAMRMHGLPLVLYNNSSVVRCEEIPSVRQNVQYMWQSHPFEGACADDHVRFIDELLPRVAVLTWLADALAETATDRLRTRGAPAELVNTCVHWCHNAHPHEVICLWQSVTEKMEAGALPPSVMLWDAPARTLLPRAALAALHASLPGELQIFADPSPFFEDVFACFIVFLARVAEAVAASHYNYCRMRWAFPHIHVDVLRMLAGALQALTETRVQRTADGACFAAEPLALYMSTVPAHIFAAATFAHVPFLPSARHGRQVYAGLENTGNYCYMNSTLQQLFMLPLVRHAILGCAVDDDSLRAHLVARNERHVDALLMLRDRVRSLFNELAYGQRGFSTVVPIAEVLSTPDFFPLESPVHHQNDAGEFFSLLLDRLGKIFLTRSSVPPPLPSALEPSPPTASTLQDSLSMIVGGTLLNQINGEEECSHRTQRAEPFVALAVEVQGQSTLQQSLEAYIHGETLSGDNAYRCDACDKKVTAEKRVVLSAADMPNVLFMHLMRFKFDMTTFMKMKVNDEFRFPDDLDMWPYTDEGVAAAASSAPRRSIKYELCGVLVHAGSAGAGHYFSFVKPDEYDVDPCGGSGVAAICSMLAGGTAASPATDTDRPGAARQAAVAALAMSVAGVASPEEAASLASAWQRAQPSQGAQHAWWQLNDDRVESFEASETERAKFWYGGYTLHGNTRRPVHVSAYMLVYRRQHAHARMYFDGRVSSILSMPVRVDAQLASAVLGWREQQQAEAFFSEATAVIFYEHMLNSLLGLPRPSQVACQHPSSRFVLVAAATCQLLSILQPSNDMPQLSAHSMVACTPVHPPAPVTRDATAPAWLQLLSALLRVIGTVTHDGPNNSVRTVDVDVGTCCALVHTLLSPGMRPRCFPTPAASPPPPSACVPNTHDTLLLHPVFLAYPWLLRVYTRASSLHDAVPLHTRAFNTFVAHLALCLASNSVSDSAAHAALIQLVEAVAAVLQVVLQHVLLGGCDALVVNNVMQLVARLMRTHPRVAELLLAQGAMEAIMCIALEVQPGMFLSASDPQRDEKVMQLHAVMLDRGMLERSPAPLQSETPWQDSTRIAVTLALSTCIRAHRIEDVAPAAWDNTARPSQGGLPPSPFALHASVAAATPTLPQHIANLVLCPAMFWALGVRHSNVEPVMHGTTRLVFHLAGPSAPPNASYGMDLSLAEHAHEPLLQHLMYGNGVNSHMIMACLSHGPFSSLPVSIIPTKPGVPFLSQVLHHLLLHPALLVDGLLRERVAAVVYFVDTRPQSLLVVEPQHEDKSVHMWVHRRCFPPLPHAVESAFAAYGEHAWAAPQHAHVEPAGAQDDVLVDLGMAEPASVSASTASAVEPPRAADTAGHAPLASAAEPAAFETAASPVAATCVEASASATMSQTFALMLPPTVHRSGVLSHALDAVVSIGQLHSWGPLSPDAHTAWRQLASVPMGMKSNVTLQDLLAWRLYPIAHIVQNSGVAGISDIVFSLPTLLPFAPDVARLITFCAELAGPSCTSYWRDFNAPNMLGWKTMFRDVAELLTRAESFSASRTGSMPIFPLCTNVDAEAYIQAYGGLNRPPPPPPLPVLAMLPTATFARQHHSPIRGRGMGPGKRPARRAMPIVRHGSHKRPRTMMVAEDVSQRDLRSPVSQAYDDDMRDEGDDDVEDDEEEEEEEDDGETYGSRDSRAQPRTPPLSAAPVVKKKPQMLMKRRSANGAYGDGGHDVAIAITEQQAKDVVRALPTLSIDISHAYRDVKWSQLLPEAPASTLQRHVKTMAQKKWSWYGWPTQVLFACGGDLPVILPHLEMREPVAAAYEDRFKVLDADSYDACRLSGPVVALTRLLRSTVGMRLLKVAFDNLRRHPELEANAFSCDVGIRLIASMLRHDSVDAEVVRTHASNMLKLAVNLGCFMDSCVALHKYNVAESNRGRGDVDAVGGDEETESMATDAASPGCGQTLGSVTEEEWQGGAAVQEPPITGGDADMGACAAEQDDATQPVWDGV